MDPQEATFVGTKLTLNTLTDRELATLNLAIQFGTAKDLPFFKKVDSLFTENNGTEMHEETLNALAVIVNTRLGK